MKTIKISEETHLLVKKYCQDNSLKLNDWIDKMIKKNIEKLNERKNVETKLSQL